MSIGQESLTSYLPGKKIYLSPTIKQDFFQALN